MNKQAISGYVKHMKDKHGLNPFDNDDFKQIIKKADIFREATEYFKQYIPESDHDNYDQLAQNTRVMLETHSAMSGSGMTYYETFTLPLLANMYPKIVLPRITTELVMDTPEVEKFWERVYFTQSGGTERIEGPSYTQAISSGPVISADIAAGETDLLALASDPLTSDVAGIERGTVIISKVSDGGVPEVANVNVKPGVDGQFGFACKLGSNDEYITGSVDYKKGLIRINNTFGFGVEFSVSCRASLEYNTISPKIELEMEKFNIIAELKEIEASFTVPYQQDMMALFKIDPAAKLLALSTEQAALDLDIEYFEKVRNVVDALPAEHEEDFDYYPDATAGYTTHEHHSNILPKLGLMAGRIKKATKVSSADVVLITNESVSSIFDSFNNFSLVRKESNGVAGYKQGEVNDGRYTTIETPILADNEIIVTLKGNDERSVISYFGNYVPAMSVNLPNSSVAAFTFMRRATSDIIRTTGFGKFNITYA